ncbi:MAG: kinase [Acidobacteria bacterium]|nr:MAG: kinase [Acidobacteriota bacterium]
MIISRTPFRVSFFGGGTDYPAWYRRHGGAVLAAAIDKYCYLTCRYLPPFFDHRYRCVYSKIESVQNIEDIEHPAIRAVLGYLGIDQGLEIHHDGDLPARSGMGSSSAFTVGLLHALHALRGEMLSSHQLALEAIHVEQEVIRETVGSQDQITAAYGGFNHIIFRENGDFEVHPVTISAERMRELNAHLLLLYTGIKRTASDIASSFVTRIDERRRQLRIMADLVREALTVLTGSGGLEAFGELLHEAWLVKRSLSNAVSNERVDSLYERARRAGAIGGKLTGAGGGGFLVLFAPPERHERIRAELANLIHVPFSFDRSGSQIIFFDHERDYSEQSRIRAQQKIDAFRELTPCP